MFRSFHRSICSRPVNRGVDLGPVAIEQSKWSCLGCVEAQLATNTAPFRPSTGTCIFHLQRDFVYIVLLFYIFVLYSYILRLEFVINDVSPFVKTMLFVVYRFLFWACAVCHPGPGDQSYGDRQCHCRLEVQNWTKYKLLTHSLHGEKNIWWDFELRNALPWGTEQYRDKCTKGYKG